MRNLRLVAIVIGAVYGLVMFLVICSSFPSTESLPFVRLTPRFSGNTGEEKEEGEEMEEDGMEKATEQEFYMTRDPKLNRIPVERLVLARMQAERMKIGAGTRDASTAGLGWQERGPNNIGGRVRAILIDKTDATSNTVIVASVGGGVWRTTTFKSATPVWTPINDFLNNLAICALAQDPRPGFRNIMYAGSGEGYYNEDNIRGMGVFKSTDYGLTWSLLSSTKEPASYDFDYVQRIVVDDLGNVYVACRSRYCNRGGIMKSADGGTNWKRVIGTVTGACATSVDLEGADIEIASNKDIYATVGLLSTTGRIYKSSFAVNGALTGDTTKWVDITPVGNYNRIEIAVAPSNSNRVYALFKGNAIYDVSEIRRTDDGGTTWTAAGTLPVPRVYNQGSNSIFTNGQAWYDLTLAVDPSHADTLIIGGLDLLRSYNAGVNWTQISNWTGAVGSFTSNQKVHADQHIILYDPNNVSNALFGNDGGVYYSSNIDAAALPSFINRNSGFNVTQYYSADLHPVTTNYILAGAQDNGTHLLNTAGIGAAISKRGGDGGFCHINQTNGLTQISAYTYNYYSYSTDGGATFADFTPPSANNGRFINPTDYDDASNFLYAADAPGIYGIINFTNLTYSNANFSSLVSTRVISAVKVDPNTANRVWFGFSDLSLTPLMLKVDNANGTPTGTAFSLPVPAGAYISSVEVQNGDPNRLLVTLSNYGVASVLESTDGGTTWNSLDNNGVNLPDMPIRWGMYIPTGYNPGQRVQRTEAIPGGIMLGTELGVWSASAINGTSTAWSANNTGLANVRVDMLKMRNSDKMVVAASHGRGIFTTILPSGALPVTFRSFSGTEEPRHNRLVWQVENEQSNKGFELERKYPGESTFTFVGFIAGKNSPGRNNYSFNDMLVDLGKETAEYRLKQLDMDGHSRYSSTIILKRKAAGRLIEYVFVNGNNLFLRVNNEADQRMVLQFLDEKGSLLKRQQVSQRSQSIDISGLTRGIYILNVTNERGDRFTQKIWK